MSRLSSLLVRDGLVGVKRMEKAFQRQVIYGGSLDTILLELALITEERLTQYLALAAGVPPATGAERTPAMPPILTRAQALASRAIGLARSDEGVRVLVCEPLELPRLEALADELDTGVQPVIAPEFRWHAAFAMAYGEQGPLRFATLVRTLDGAAATPAVGRTRTVVVSPELPAEPSPIAPVAPDAPTSRMAAVEPPPEAAEPVRRVAEWDDVAPTDPGTREMALAVVEARVRIAGATERDAIWAELLAGLRLRTQWAAIFTVQAGVATGRAVAAAAGLDGDGALGLALPIEALPLVAATVKRRQAQVGSLATGDAGIDGTLARLGVAPPPPALVLPIVLGERVVAVALAHRAGAALSLAELTDLLPLGTAAAEALAQIIARAKATAPAATAAASGSLPVDAAGTPPGRDTTPMPAASAPIEVLLAAAETGDPDAVDAILDRADEAAPYLAARFPGPLRTTRYQVRGRPLRASQHGPLLDLVVQLGPPALPWLAQKMADADRDVRYYATACVAELRPAAALPALVARAFDDDYGVRACALEALAGYPLRELEPHLPPLRTALGADDVEAVAAATAAIAELGDLGAIDELIDAVDTGGRRSELARSALVALTRQDHGTAAKKWRAWWEANASRHRVEWLIDALDHKDETLRHAAIDELRRITGEARGYAPDLGRRDRDAAIERWRTWWRDVGRPRFT